MNVMPLGTKGTSGEYAGSLGSKHCFKDWSSTVTGGVRVPPTGVPIEAILVQNNSGGAVTPGTIVLWDTANVGTKTGTITGAAGIGAGLVDPFIPAGTTVANGELFWLIRKGRVKGTSGASYSTGVQLIPNSAGKFIVMTADVAGLQARCARACEAATGADESKYVYLDFQV